jgi:hypothetical protein
MTHWSFLSPLVLTLFLWKIFYGHLLTHEQQIKLHNIALDLSSSSVHMAQRHPSFSNNNSHGSNHASHGRGCSPHNNSFSQSNSSNWPLCQICGRVSHFSIKCYNRFNHTSKPSPPGLASSFFLNFFFLLLLMWLLIPHGIMIRAPSITRRMISPTSTFMWMSIPLLIKSELVMGKVRIYHTLVLLLFHLIIKISL